MENIAEESQLWKVGQSNLDEIKRPATSFLYKDVLSYSQKNQLIAQQRLLLPKYKIKISVAESHFLLRFKCFLFDTVQFEECSAISSMAADNTLIVLRISCVTSIKQGAQPSIFWYLSTVFLKKIKNIFKAALKNIFALQMGSGHRLWRQFENSDINVTECSRKKDSSCDE